MTGTNGDHSRPAAGRWDPTQHETADLASAYTVGLLVGEAEATTTGNGAKARRRPKAAQQPELEPEDTYEDMPDEPGHVVLDAVRDWLASHVAYASTHHALTVALWVAHTHALDRACSTGRLAFTSPEPESGKTRNLELLELVCRRGRLVLQMSPASMYRWVEAITPTILLDEVDAVFGPLANKDHEDLRALINAGHRPGATVPRVESPSMRVVEYSAYCPVALAGLGSLPDTIRSRAIVIPMRRRAPDQTVRPYRERITRPEGDQLRRRLAAWVARHGHAIPEAPDLPDGVTDRQADSWEPLIAVADAAAGHWPQSARAACAAIVSAARNDLDDQSLGIRLLADIHHVFAGADRMTTTELLTGLHAIEEAPWGDLRGKAITARWLAQKLKHYGATPRDHRFGDETRKGYLAQDFHDAWSRYPVKGNKGNKGNAPGSPVADVAHVAHTPLHDQPDQPATQREKPDQSRHIPPAPPTPTDLWSLEHPCTACGTPATDISGLCAACIRTRPQERGSDVATAGTPMTSNPEPTLRNRRGDHRPWPK